MWNISRLSTNSINPIGTLTNESLNFISTLKFDRAITPSAVRPRYSTDSPLRSGKGTWRDRSSVTSSFLGNSSDLCIHSKLDGSSWQAWKNKYIKGIYISYVFKFNYLDSNQKITQINCSVFTYIIHFWRGREEKT